MRSHVDRHLGALSGLTAYTRFTLAAAGQPRPALDLPPEFSWHDYALFLLSMAAEIEHSLMVQYLFAAWTLGGPQVEESHRGDVLAWQNIVLGIAKEEMGHLITVQNVIKLLGGPVHLDREAFPWNSTFYPYQLSLERLSRESLAKYIVAESPAIWPASVTDAERKTIEQLAKTDTGKDVRRVGELYQLMIDLLADGSKLPDRFFRPETYPSQASWDEWGRGYAAGARGTPPLAAPDLLIQRVSSRTEAVAALKMIADQGEAPLTIDANDEDSHFTRFLHVYRGFSGSDAVLPVATNPVVSGLGAVMPAAVIENPEARLWGGLFNLRYRMLLAWLAHALRLSDDPAQSAAPGHRGQVVNRIFGEMYQLKAIAGMLMRLPLANDPAVRAGPPFEMPYTLNYPVSEMDFWRSHLDLFDASAAQLMHLCRQATGPRLAYAEALKKADQEAVQEIRTTLGQDHATSRYLRAGGNVR